MPYAITTRYAGPTNHHGSRILARTYHGRRLTVPYDHALSPDDNHRRAAIRLACRVEREQFGAVRPEIEGRTVGAQQAPGVRVYIVTR